MFMCIFPVKVNLGTLCCQVVLYAIWWLEVFFKHCTIIINLPLLSFLFCDFSLCVISNVNILPVYFLTSFLAPLSLSAPPPCCSKALLVEITDFLFSFSCFPSQLVPWHFTPEVHEPGMWHDFWFTPPRCNTEVCMCVWEREQQSWAGRREENKRNKH